MKKTALALTACVCIILALNGLWVEAAPPIPASFYGTVRVNGANPPTYVSVEALIGGVTYAVVPVRVDGGNVVYALDVPGDVAELPGKQGGTDGETIQFKIGGLLCGQTGTWHEGVHTHLDLTASGALPTITPTETAVSTDTPTTTPTPTITPRVSPTPAVVDFEPTQDTFISSWEQNTNYGTDHRLKVRSGAYRSLVYFDLLSSIPTHATVTNATLHLYLDWYEHQTQSSPNVSLHKVLTDWDEMQSTWNHRLTAIAWDSPGCESASDRDTTASSSTTVTEVNSWYTWEVTALVQDWAWHPEDNKGTILISDSGRELRFHSGNYPTNKPRLHVEYTTGGSPPTRTATATPTGTPSVEPTPQSIEIRNASQDAYVDVGEPTEPHENEGLYVSGLGYKRSLLNFNVSEIPSSAQIVSATLRLTAGTYDPHPERVLDVGVYLVNRPWVAVQMTWNSASTGEAWAAPGCHAVPDDRSGAPASTTVVRELSTGTAPGQRKTYDWDVTSIVQSWLGDFGGQAGLILISEDEIFRNIGFHDSAFMGEAGRDLHPVLYVQWRGMTPTPTLTPGTPTMTPTASYSTVQGTVYNDLNVNGIREAGELGTIGANVQLLKNDVIVAQQVTPGDGEYTLTGINPGGYMLKVIEPSGYASSTQNPRYVSLSAGQVRTEDFGVFQASFWYLTLLFNAK